MISCSVFFSLHMEASKYVPKNNFSDYIILSQDFSGNNLKIETLWKLHLGSRQIVLQSKKIKNADILEDRPSHIFRSGCTPGNGISHEEKAPPDRPSHRHGRRYIPPHPSGSAPD